MNATTNGNGLVTHTLLQLSTNDSAATVDGTNRFVGDGLTTAQRHGCTQAHQTVPTLLKRLKTFFKTKPKIYSMSGGKAKMGASKGATSVDDEDVFTRADIQKEVRSVLAANHGMLTADQVEIFQSLSYATAKQLVEVILNLLREASAVPLQPKPSPSRASVITQCDETFKKIASPCDPDFFIPFKDTFKDSSIPEFWQHFRGHLLAAPNGHIGCASCSVEAVLSANGTSLLCPKRAQYGDAKKAQEQGCFFIIRSRVGELTVEKQDEVSAYNDAKNDVKNSKGLKKTSELVKEILANKRAKSDE